MRLHESRHGVAIGRTTMAVALVAALGGLPQCAGAPADTQAPPGSTAAPSNGAPVVDSGGAADGGESTPTQPNTRAGEGAPDAGTTSEPSSSDAASADASPCAPAMTGMRGLTMQTAIVGGATRTYLMYLPQSLDPAAPAPLVYVFHGASMSGQQMHDITQYADLADKEGIAVLFPDGEGAPFEVAPWNVENVGQTVCGAGQFVSAQGDDFGFMDAMRATLGAYQCVDASHVFATGFSMGGYFAHHIGCYRDDIRAVAPHSGGTISSLSSCTTGHRPVIIFHGTADGTIAPGCDAPSSPAQSGFPPSATLWAQHNGCGTTYTTVQENGDGGGGGQCLLYDGCPAGGQVELCTFTGMPHCWAGGSTAGQGALSACPTYPSATQLEWSFFKKYAW